MTTYNPEQKITSQNSAQLYFASVKHSFIQLSYNYMSRHLLTFLRNVFLMSRNAMTILRCNDVHTIIVSIQYMCIIAQEIWPHKISRLRLRKL